MTRRVLAALLLAASGIATGFETGVRTGFAQEAWLPKQSADLILLDKVRGQPTALTVKVGESAAFGSITIRVRNCSVRPPDQPADATAFVEVSDSRGKGDVFRGWIIADAPGISQMEHPVYDLKLAGCR